MRMSTWIRQHLAALRALLVLTVITGIVYPVAVFAVAQLPGLNDKADGSLIERDGKLVGSSLIGQSFTDADGNAMTQYFQSRPSAAGDGYDPLSTAASNLGPEDIVDTPARKSLLTTVCTRSKEVGDREGVDGARQFCTKDGVGAVLSVIGPRDDDGDVSRPAQVVSVNELCPARPFLSTFRGAAVECAKEGEDYSVGRIIPILGDAPVDAAVPADAVTASGSGLDPHISPEYAAIQVARVARVRGITAEQVSELVAAHTAGRTLGFLGEPRVNVVELNLALDERFPFQG
ncbi:potassium-transporting ATPase KdpC subunit [Nocardia neocaledoniensis NBRC 108232]|uniref:Potassium-transporting ATPase KdpC subunit n=1 Tax=Nocardia neocaledoniensis TaxID=236511 RepID=A0A317P0T8_9NOCA|nr:potassium-transporting ATPase subunit C [Nocardia neocaledoniensis]PWV81386.1 K+-transporting ATPase ATPase C chain [Nocardia neocaledoniensis]GEM32937.1 potassium-transporting ATPase KdpC subunit [Nocardia neocaledoniensis NBRC 108232]